MSQQGTPLAESARPPLQIVPAPANTERNSNAFHQSFDVFFASAGLILLSPLLIAIAAAIKLQNDGPVLYKQPRVGRHFRVFHVYKFRTMVRGADKSGLLTAPNDSRITALGKLLRKYKLDELPQLLNVIKGDMQLVGPRPEVERYVALFHSAYAVLLRERPGITDPATIAHRREDTLLTGELVEQQYISRLLPAKVQMSLDYQRRRTFLSDLDVLFRTVTTLFMRA